MSIQVKIGMKCPNCGAALHVGEEDRSTRCRYCQTVVEISRFTQEEKRLVRAIEEMQESVSQAERHMEEALEEFARTGSAAAGTAQQQAEAHYRALSEELEKQQAAYENAQARRLGGYFRLGEEAQRARRYEEAIGHYQKILAVCDEEAEVHWRVLMCRYGVEYVRDQLTGTYLPTLTKMQVDDILRDADYQAACRYAQDEEASAYYCREGERLAEILAKYQYIGGTAEPYDVFISVKQGDDAGRPTEDSMVGMNLYYQLTAQGLRVFNSRMSLKAGEEYEPHIMHALMTAQVLVLVASSEEYLNARWLRNEWRRFAWLKKNGGMGSERRIIVYSCAQNMLRIPAEIGAVQIIDSKSAVAPVEMLYHAVRDVCQKGAQEVREAAAVPQAQEAEKRVKKAAKDNEKQSKKDEKAARKQEKKSAEPMPSVNRSEERISEQPDAAKAQPSEGRKSQSPAAITWILWALGAAAGVMTLPTNALAACIGLIGLWPLSRKSMQVKCGGRSRIIRAGLIGLPAVGANYLISRLIRMGSYRLMAHCINLNYMTVESARTAQVWIILLTKAVWYVALSAVCVKIADRLTAERRELVLSVIGWLIVAGFSIAGIFIDGLNVGVETGMLTSLLTNACLIAGTLLWLRRKKANS